MRDGLIYLQDAQTDRLVIPRINAIILPLLQQHHDVPIAGHLGAHKTYDSIRRNYYWLGLEDSVKKYVRTCEKCNIYKPDKQKPAGMTQSLPIPSKPWEVVTMDFIVKLPTTPDGFDTIFVVVDKLSKYCHFIPCKETIDAEGVADLFFNHIFANHGMPTCIVSDRDRRFESKFWKAFHKLMGTKLAMSTAYHPQTNRQTEERNQLLEQVLRTVISHDQNDWKDKLPMCQFVCNNMVTPTRKSVFKVATGYDPITPGTLGNQESNSESPKVDEMVEERKIIIQEATDALKEAQATQEEQYNKKRRMQTYRLGDQVWLNTKNLRWAKKMARPTDKLAERKLGPYKITRVISDLAYTIDIPKTWKVHPTFSVSLLSPYLHPNTYFQGRQAEPPPPVEMEDDEDTVEYEVEEILKWKPLRKNSDRKLYLVKWKGWNTSENSWEPIENLNCPNKLKEFMDKQANSMESSKRETNSTFRELNTTTRSGTQDELGNLKISESPNRPEFPDNLNENLTLTESLTAEIIEVNEKRTKTKTITKKKMMKGAQRNVCGTHGDYQQVLRPMPGQEASMQRQETVQQVHRNCNRVHLFDATTPFNGRKPSEGDKTTHAQGGSHRKGRKDQGEDKGKENGGNLAEKETDSPEKKSPAHALKKTNPHPS